MMLTLDSQELELQEYVRLPGSPAHSFPKTLLKFRFLAEGHLHNMTTHCSRNMFCDWIECFPMGYPGIPSPLLTQPSAMRLVQRSSFASLASSFVFATTKSRYRRRSCVSSLPSGPLRQFPFNLDHTIDPEKISPHTSGYQEPWRRRVDNGHHP